jgi:hypothetical protein
MAVIMGATVLTVALGAIFIVLGRWLYRNPTKIGPKWGILNREHPGVQRVARAYATFFIFFGMFAAAIGIISRLLPGWPEAFLGLVVAVTGAWLLRPRLDQPPSPTIESGLRQGQVAEKPSLLNKHWKRTLGIFAVLMAAAGIVIPALVADSDVSKLAFATAQANPIVRQRLGEPVKRGFFTSGSIEISGPSGHADIEISIKGPKGKADLYAVGTKSAGLWKLDVLRAEFNGNSERVDLLKQTTDSDQPPKL